MAINTTKIKYLENSWKFFRDLDYGLCSVNICSMFFGASILNIIVSSFQISCLILS